MSDPKKSAEGRSGVPFLGIWFIELLTAAKGGEIITSGTHLQIAVSLTYFGLRMLEFWCQHGKTRGSAHVSALDLQFRQQL